MVLRLTIVLTRIAKDELSLRLRGPYRRAVLVPRPPGLGTAGFVFGHGHFGIARDGFWGGTTLILLINLSRQQSVRVRV